jgi:hypothetical protein
MPSTPQRTPPLITKHAFNGSKRGLDARRLGLVVKQFKSPRGSVRRRAMLMPGGTFQ